MKKTESNWSQLLNPGRRKKAAQELQGMELGELDPTESRTEIERDYDRILFSTPVRRLADKTQVFPLDKNDSVRTRLTHSHEVSNLARSIGTALAFKHKVASSVGDALRNVPALLAATGLVHDLGNPPFGHQGEAAIQSWFKLHTESVLGELSNTQHKNDFLLFEGNAQAFRLVTRLQLLNDDFGLDLTYATLAAMMKYPTTSDAISDAMAATKKHGFFATERHVVDQVQAATGLSLGKRHALAYLMEACDDIAYVVLDAEDAIKKGLASFSDMANYLQSAGAGDSLLEKVVSESKAKHEEYKRPELGLSPAELNDVSMQRFRVYAIGAMVRSVTDAFLTLQDELVSGDLAKPLLEVSTAEKLRKALKNFSVSHAYRHRTVLEVELQGFNVIHELMDLFWASIVDRKDKGDPASKRKQPFTRYVYGLISENYRRVFENPTEVEKALPMRYRECLLLTDMISGMTDSFAVDMHKELVRLQGRFDPSEFLTVTKK